PGAAALDVTAGSEVRLIVYRSLAGRRENVEVPLKVRSILRLAADPERRAYINLEVVQAIENYRAGIPVPSRGWHGLTSPPQQVFHGAYLLLETPLDEVDIHSIRARYGFAESNLVSAQGFTKATGLPSENATQIVLFFNKNNPVRAQVIKEMTTQLGGQKYQVLPIVINMQVVAEPIDQRIPVRTADPTQFKLPSVIAGTAAGWEAWRTNASYIQAERILIPQKLAAAYTLGDRLRLKVVPNSSEDASQDLTIEVLVDGVVNE